MTPSQEVLKKFGLKEPDAIDSIAENKVDATENTRRSFLKRSALGGVALGSAFLFSPVEELVAQSTQKINRNSSPSELKITDMRYCVTTVLGRTAMIRIDTNQGIYGLGEVRDGADERYALMLKSRILGMNPCNVEMIFKTIKQFGGQSRQAGGVCAVEMALWDIVGKAYNVPAWQLLGGRYRDKVRLYADTPEAGSPEEQKKLMNYRINEQGYTWLKMDLGINELKGKQGSLVNDKFWQNDQGDLQQWGNLNDPMSYGNTLHPFTQIQITDKGLDELAQLVENVRNMLGYSIPLSSDHYGHFDVNNGIRLGKRLEKYRLAWLEDVISWEKRIGDYAEEHGIAMAMHQAGTPISFMAGVHCAAATQNFLALEHHSIDLPWWESLVKTTDGRNLITKGFANLPLSAPGLGIELNDEVVKQHLHPSDKTYFEPTSQWNDRRSHDRTFS